MQTFSSRKIYKESSVSFICLNFAEEQSEEKDHEAEEKLRGKYLKWDGSMPLLKNVLFKIKEHTEKALCKFSMQKITYFYKN